MRCFTCCDVVDRLKAYFEPVVIQRVTQAVHPTDIRRFTLILTVRRRIRPHAIASRRLGFPTRNISLI